MNASSVASVLAFSLLALFVSSAALQRRRMADSSASNGWQQLYSGHSKPKYARLAEFAVRKFTTGVEHYHVLNKLLKVEKKGKHYKLTFLYAPTHCSVTDVFEPDRCKAVGSKPSGQCEAVVTVEKKGPSVEWIDCADFGKKVAVQRTSKLNNSGRSP